MEKPASAEHDIHDLMRSRWSPRAFSEQPVGDAELRSLLEAARWAASCFNEQPWRYLVARREDKEDFDRLLQCLTEKNQSWASRAAVLMLSVASKNFAHNEKPNRHCLHDVGQATAQLTLQAASMGLCVHQMAGYSVDKAREAFGIPDDFEPGSAIAIGYPGDPQSLPESLREPELAPRKRRPQAEFVFGGRWGQALPGSKTL